MGYKSIGLILFLSLSCNSWSKEAERFFKNPFVDFEATNFQNFTGQLKAKVLLSTLKDCKECESVSCVQNEKHLLIATADTDDSKLSRLEVRPKLSKVSPCPATTSIFSNAFPVSPGMSLSEAKKFLGDPVKETKASAIWCFDTYKKASPEDLSLNFPDDDWISVTHEIELTVAGGTVTGISLLRAAELTQKNLFPEKQFQKTSKYCSFRGPFNLANYK